MGGHAGKILYVDLCSGSTREEPLDPTFARRYIGGLGFSASLYLDLVKGQMEFDALSAKNPFIIMTGPLTGVRMHGVARWTVASKSPLTGLWGDANVGGFFGARLKFAGYDGIVIIGAAERPTYLHIDDDRVELRDAGKYWGKDIYTVTDEMVADHKAESNRPGEVLTIGPAGESLVKLATITNNKGHTAGRTGLGAVWGAKKLKAIFVRGSGTVAVAYPDRLQQLRDELQPVYDDSIQIQALREAGTVSVMDAAVLIGDIPMKNWQQSEWEQFDEIGPAAYADKILTGRKSCYACGVMCKRQAAVSDGPFGFAQGPGPEYETVAAFGPLCLNPSLESIGKANEICNRYGIDTISCGATIAFAIECYESGLITENDTDGLQLTWGNSEAIVALAEMIGRREGFGAILAQGSAAAAAHIGRGAADFVTTVKGLETPMHDPRGAHGMGLAYAVSPRGACHDASLAFSLESGAMHLPEFDEQIGDLEEMSSQGKALLNVLAEDFGMFFSSCAGFCILGAMPLTVTQAVEMVNHVTGFDYTIAEVMQLGRRVWYLKRGLSNLFGARAEHDQLPQRLRTPLPDGPTEGSTPDMDLMLREYYALRSFDAAGLPKPDILAELDLPELAEALCR